MDGKNDQKGQADSFDIHVMPQKFQQNLGAKSRRSLSKWLILIFIIVIFLAALGVGAFFLLSQVNQPKPVTNQPPIETNTAPIENANLNEINQNANLNELNQNINLPEINANSNLNEVNTNGNVNEVNTNLNNSNVNGLNLNAGQIITYTSSLDSDNDGLTDVEEALYGTEVRQADTDNDGYSDGNEILNLYNPKAAGGALLQTSGLVNLYSNPTYSYELLYPSSWLARPVDQSLRQVIFLSSTEEYIEVSVEDNTAGSDLLTWYLAQSPGTDTNLLVQSKTKQGLDSLASPDKMTYYLASPDRPNVVIVMNYNAGVKTELNYLTTFGMMRNSLKLLKTP